MGDRIGTFPEINNVNEIKESPNFILYSVDVSFF